MRIKLLFSPKKDPDFIGIRKKIGDKNLAALIRVSLRTLTNPYLDRSKINELLARTEDSPSDDDSILTVSLTSQKDKDLADVLEHVKPGLRSAFIKTLTRQILGTKALLPYFFNDDFPIGQAVQYDETVIASLGQLREPASKKKKAKSEQPRKKAQAPKITVPKQAIKKEEPPATISFEAPPTFSPLPDIIPEKETKETELSADDALAMLENILN